MLRVIGGRQLTSEWLAARFQTTYVTSNTWTSVPFGDAAPDRKIIVIVWTDRAASGSSRLSSVTIGGIAATEAAYLTVTLARYGWSAWVADVPTGTSGNITLVSSATQIRHAGIYRVTGLKDGIVDAATGDGTPAATASIEVPGNGLVLAGCTEISTGTGTFTWSGDVLEASDKDFDGTPSSQQSSWASKLKGAAGPSQSVTATNSGSRLTQMIATSWR